MLRDEDEEAEAAAMDEATEEAVAAAICWCMMEVAVMPPAAVVRPMAMLTGPRPEDIPGPEPTEEEGCWATGLMETIATPEDDEEEGTDEGVETWGKEEECRLESPSTPPC